MDLYAELTAIIDCLDDHSIDYALCGGLAVAVHGYPRFTGDIDIMLMIEDFPRAKNALKTIGFSIDAGPFPFDSGTERAREVHRISRIVKGDVFTLDILIVNDMLMEVWNGRELYELEGQKICVVSRQGLITMKTLAGRDRDLVDIKNLMKDDGDDEK